MTRSRQTAGAGLVVAAIVALAGCDEQTAVFVRVDLKGKPVTQLRFEGRTTGGEGLFGPLVRPEVEGGSLSGTPSLRVLLPDSAAGERVQVEVVGLSGGVAIARGEGLARVALGTEVEVTVTLGPPEPVEPAVCGADCAGCCRNGECVALSLFTCGSPGTSCLACDALRADRCRADGICSCGESGPCPAGLRCAGGLCVCDEQSCPEGCCLGNECRARSLSACGTLGAGCYACDAGVADRCGPAGDCRCGEGPPCVAGQRCEGGACLCDGRSCPDGCCQGNRCVSGRDPAACGNAGLSCSACPPGEQCVEGVCTGCLAHCATGCCSGAECRARSLDACGVGTACVSCDPARATSCGPTGQCLCGEGLQCAPGQRCLRGGCICDAVSCPDGCCSEAGSCVSAGLNACALPGERCLACDANLADRCGAAGQCQCGAGPACQVGQRCEESRCACDASSCPAGCCDHAGLCQPLTVSACAPGGQVCLSCNPEKADGCSRDGICTCGAGSRCGPGQRCWLGRCVCDVVSCPDGCCESGVCRLRSVDLCGPAGAICASCASALADSCSPEGACRCGSGPACSSGSRCEQGVCICDALSCPEGCCEQSLCHEATAAACGTGGELCAPCDSEHADGCSSGSCTCGGGPACGQGQRCTAGVCRCDPATCAGCCEGEVCRPGTDPFACGFGGAACSVCPAGETCSAGVCSGCARVCAGCCAGATCYAQSLATCGLGGEVCLACDPVRANRCAGGNCQCGTKAACDAGQRCDAGVCVCDASSCPNGCCWGAQCAPLSLAACGGPGADCQRCDPRRADHCAGAGGCGCGGGPECAAGQACVAGECRCTPDTCAGCCDGDSCLQGVSAAACGTGGAQCQVCASPLKCSGGICR